MDIVSYLHLKLVKEHRFKIHDGYGRDPRPLLKEAIRNWEHDEERRREREEPLDYEAVLKVPDPAPSIEDSVLENRAYEEGKRELLALGFLRSREEFDLFETVCVDECPLDEVRKRLGISSDLALRKRLLALRKRLSRARKHIRE